MMKEGIKFMLVFIIIFIIIIPGFIITFGMLSSEMDSQQVLKEHGIKMSSSEYECYSFCDGKDYLYKPGSAYNQMLCECKRE